MKTSLLGALALGLLALAGCQNPVSNPTSVKASSGLLPLGAAAGVSVYATGTDGYGVQVYRSNATNWTSLDWSNCYPSGYNLSLGMYFPPVHDVTTDSAGTVYAATDDGLIVGSGTSWLINHQGTVVNAVAISGSTVFISTQTGLLTTSTASPSYWTSLGISDNVRQWVSLGTGKAVAVGALGLYYSSNPAGNGSYALATSSGTPLNSSGINGAFYYTPASTLYVGTSLGLSTTTGAGAPFTWTNKTLALNSTNYPANQDLGGAVNAVARVGNTVVLGTSTGLTYSVDGGTTWWPLYLGTGVTSVAAGANPSTFYAANGQKGVAILTIAADGTPSLASVLTNEATVSKVWVTQP